MAVTNFPYLNRPRTLQQVCFQDVAIATIKSWLAKDSIPSSVCFFGSTGSGKTVSAKLMVQATHCLNREPGGTDACGNCAICNSDPQYESGYGNVVWVSAQNSKDGDNKEITYQAAVIDALHAADRGPSYTGRPHADILFIVFEEAHLLPKHLFQRCLARSDAFDPLRDRVVLVFISMAIEQLDAQARQAVSQRGAVLNLQTPTQTQLSSYLYSKFQVSPQVCEVLAKYANGSVRGALAAYKDCLDFIQPVTLESVSLKLSLDDIESSFKIWNLILSKPISAEFKKAVDSLIANKSVEHINEKLQEDLDKHWELLGEDLWWSATLLLSQVANNPSRLSFTYTLLNLKQLNWPLTFAQAIANDCKPSFVTRLLQEPWTDLYYGR
jgi:hypothetical protein